MIRLGFVDTKEGRLWSTMGRIRVEASRTGGFWYLTGEYRNTSGNWVPFAMEALSEQERAALVAMCEASEGRRAA
jgi:hypothetical protein